MCLSSMSFFSSRTTQGFRIIGKTRMGRTAIFAARNLRFFFAMLKILAKCALKSKRAGKPFG